MLKKLWSIGIAFLFTTTLFVSNILACACCAEPGHYSIRTSKPDQFVFDLLKDINFTSANLYTDAGYPDSIIGIKPLGESFKVKNDFASDLWKVNFKDDKSKSGDLELLKPLSMVEYMVDLNPTKATPTTLYKELRFKYKLNNATGIFQNGFDANNEYFLVLQGKGNVCSNPEDFKHYRLEITGKKADYMFYGSINNYTASGLKLEALKGDYSGCSCSIQTESEAKRAGKWKTFNFYADLGEQEKVGYFNFGGADEKFPLIKQGKQAETLKVGSKHTDVYEKDGTTISIEYTVKTLPCEECEGIDYDVVITTKKGDQISVEKGAGSCGC